MADFLFTTPVVAEGPATWTDPLFHRVKLNRGITILETGGAFTAVRFPTQDEIRAADTVYMGGHEYTVDDATKTALIAGGVDVTEDNFTAL